MMYKLNNNNLHISEGNNKLGNIENFNLPPVLACCPEACKTCAKDCYALRYYKRWPNVKNAYNDNLATVKTDLKGFINFMIDYFNDINAPRLFRVHAAGDFFSVDYAKAWFEIIKASPNTRFLIYTKAYENISNIDFYTLQNCALYLSEWPGLDIPKDLQKHYKIAYLNDWQRDLKTFENAFTCPGDCKACKFECWRNNQNIRFDIH